MRAKPPPRILLGEDNLSLAEALVTLLAKKGLQVSHARDGVATLSRVIADSPDLLILDLRLPRLHGVELLKKLRQSPRTRNLPVIIISGAYLGDRYIESARRLGVRHYLAKPFKPAQLLSAIQDELQWRADYDNTLLVRTLCRLYRQRFSGQLKVRHAGRSRVIDVINGLPVGLRPGFKTGGFGHYLLEQDQLSAEEFDYYQQSEGESHASLVQMGCLDYPGLQQARLAYLTSELVHAGSLPGLQVEQQPFGLPSDLEVVTVNLPQIIHEIFRRTATTVNRRALSRILPKYPTPGERYYQVINFLQLDQAERELLQQLTGSRRLADLLAENTSGLALIRCLLALDMLQLGDVPPAPAAPDGFPLRVLFNAPDKQPQETTPERLESFADVLAGPEEAGGNHFHNPDSALADSAPTTDLEQQVRSLHADLQGKNFYQIFALQPGNFSFDRLKKSYFDLTRGFGPETLMQLGGEAAEQIQDILSTVTTAYNTLSDVVKKERYDELLNSDKVGLGQQGDERFQAQVQYQSAQVFLGMEEWANAERALQDACNIEPDNGRYLADLAWSIYRNPNNAASRAMLEKARQLLGRALQLEKSANGFAYKGWMHFAAGQDTLAEAEFNKALRIDSRQLLARQGLRELQEKHEQEKKGLFRKLFR